MATDTPSSDQRIDGRSAAHAHAQAHAQAQHPPPAPPLPPLRYGQRAAATIAKIAHPWLTSHSSTSDYPATAELHLDRSDDAHKPLTDRPGSGRYRSAVTRSSSPESSQSAVHKTGIPIAALDISPYRTHAVLAGRDILKTVRVGSGGSAAEDVNIRSSIIAYASAHSSSRAAVSARHRDQLAANDVRWSNGNYDTFIATAAAAGRIVIYDLNRAALELTTLVEHARQVHKLAFNPFKGELLLSGSQDGGIKLWDIRSAASSRRSQSTFNAHDQGIRDVKWSSNDGVEFATGTEGGVVQRWDIRRPAAPIIKLKAHDRTCQSIDYHPSGRFIVSGGADKVVKVWDTTRSDKRQNPAWTLHAPHNVHNVCWRPCTRSGNGEGLASTSSSIATSYDGDPRTHIWDLRRPTIPFQEIDRYETPATGLLWHSDDLLWTVGGSGTFTQTDLKHVPKPLDRLTVNNFVTAPDGSINIFSDRRAPKRMPAPDTEDAFLPRSSAGGSSGEKLGSSVSANEGSLDDGGLLASTLRRRRKKAAGQRLLAGRARNGDEAAFPQAESSFGLEPTFTTTQVAAVGQVRGIFDAKAFQYLAEHYERPTDLNMQSDPQTVANELEQVFLKNSHHAVCAGDHGLAHIWRILAWAVKKEIETWTQDPELVKLKKAINSRSRQHSIAAPTTDMIRTASASTVRDESHLRSPLSLITAEGGSNVATPRVRPAPGASHVPILPPGSLGDEPSGSQYGQDPERPRLLVPPVVEIRKTEDPRVLDAIPQTHISADPMPSHEATQPGAPSRPIPIPASQTARTEETTTTIRGEQTGHSSIPSFSDFEEQMAARRAALTEYRHTPRRVLRLGQSIGGIPGSSIPQSPTRAIDAPRPGIDRHDSGESFNLLSESLGSQQTSLNFSSFEDSPVKGRKDHSEPYKVDVEHKIEDRLLVPELGKQAAAEESERLLQEMTGSNMRSESYTEATRTINETVSKSSISMGSARRPSEDLKAVVHTAEIESVSSPNVTDRIGNGSRQKGSNPIQDYFGHAIYLDHAHDKPWHASSFLPSLLSHYLDHLSFVQLPTFLALYLHPFYPSIFPTRKSVSAGIVPNSILTLSRLNATVLSYHAQLVSLKHYIPAAQLRRDCAPVFPTASTLATPGKVAGFWCRICQKPSKGKMNGICTRCKKTWGGCMVCGELKLSTAKYKQIEHDTTPSQRSIGDNARGNERQAEVDQRRPKAERTRSNVSQAPARTKTQRCKKNKGARWAYCSICAHGGHASCLTAWFGSTLSKGGCAINGCTHACAPGPLRDEQRAESAREKAELSQLRRGAGVLRDERVVGESKAVREARNGDLPGDATDSGGGIVISPSKNDHPRTGSGLAGIPMESVREGAMFDIERGGIGIGMGRARGRWRSGGLAGATSTRGGRNSTGSSGGAPLGDGSSTGAGSSVEGSIHGSNNGINAGVMADAAQGLGHRRVTIVEPGSIGEDELAIEFATETSTSSSVP